MNPKEIKAELKNVNTALSKAALKYIERLEAQVSGGDTSYHELFNENLRLQKRIEKLMDKLEGEYNWSTVNDEGRVVDDEFVDDGSGYDPRPMRVNRVWEKW